MKGHSGRLAGIIALLMIAASLGAAASIAYGLYSEDKTYGGQTAEANAVFSDENAAPKTYSYVAGSAYSAPGAAIPSGLSIAINNGSEYAASENVALTLHANGAEECRYKNDEDSDWGAWEPYAEEKNWTLSAGGDGERIVAYQCKNDAGFDASYFAYAGITLDRSAPAVAYSISAERSMVEAQILVREALSGTVSCLMNFDGKESGIVVQISSYRGNATYSMPAAGGKHVFSLKCTDAAGNSREAPAQEIMS